MMRKKKARAALRDDGLFEILNVAQRTLVERARRYAIAAKAASPKPANAIVPGSGTERFRASLRFCGRLSRPRLAASTGRATAEGVAQGPTVFSAFPLVK